MGNKEKKIDVLLELYKINDNYHNVKDNLIWLCSLIYITFIFTFGSWLISNSEKRSANKLEFSIIVIIVSVFAFIFIFVQNGYKSKSVFITSNLNSSLKKMENNEITFDTIVSDITPSFICKEKIKILFTKGKIGVLILVAIIILAIFEIIAICCLIK